MHRTILPLSRQSFPLHPLPGIAHGVFDGPAPQPCLPRLGGVGFEEARELALLRNPTRKLCPRLHSRSGQPVLVDPHEFTSEPVATTHAWRSPEVVVWPDADDVVCPADPGGQSGQDKGCDVAGIDVLQRSGRHSGSNDTSARRDTLQPPRQPPDVLARAEYQLPREQRVREGFQDSEFGPTFGGRVIAVVIGGRRCGRHRRGLVYVQAHW